MSSHIINNFYENKDCLIPANKQEDLTTEQKIDKALQILQEIKILLKTKENKL